MTSTPDLLPQTDTVTVNGRQLVLYPLRLDEVRAWNRWARAEFITPALDACKALDGQERLDREHAAFQEAKAIAFWDTPSFPIMDTTEGRLKTVELSLSRGPQPMMAAEVAAIFRDDNGLMRGSLADAAWRVYVLSGYVSAKTLLPATPAEKKTETSAPATP